MEFEHAKRKVDDLDFYKMLGYISVAVIAIIMMPVWIPAVIIYYLLKYLLVVSFWIVGNIIEEWRRNDIRIRK